MGSHAGAVGGECAAARRPLSAGLHQRCARRQSRDARRRRRSVANVDELGVALVMSPVRRRRLLRGHEVLADRMTREGQQALRPCRSHSPSGHQSEPADLFPDGRGGELREGVGDLPLVASGEVPLYEAAFRRHRAPDVCDPYIRMEPGTSTPSAPPPDDQGERRTGRCTRRMLPVRPGGAGPQPRARHVDRVSMTGRQPAAVV
jgi:hypothetical protein